jgi:hypothetical protein
MLYNVFENKVGVGYQLSIIGRDLNYEKPVEVIENTRWVGFEDAITGFPFGFSNNEENCGGA